LVFDYLKFAEPFCNRIRENAEKMAAEAGIEIGFIRKRNFRKEGRVKEILATRGTRGHLTARSGGMATRPGLPPPFPRTGTQYIGARISSFEGQRPCCFAQSRNGAFAAKKVVTIGTTATPK
jgi:hypothetical protein